jgi:dipeptidyl aminopeptidase/acylaminoacyl peptidase
VALAGGEVRAEKTDERGCLTGLGAAGAGLVANWEAATSPPEVYALSTSGAAAKRLTNFNEKKVASLDLAPLEHFWFTSRGGKKIHSMLLRPPGFDAAKKYPLFVVIHGGAANMWRDAWVLRWNYHLLAAPGYAVLLTDYTGSTGYGEKFSQEIQFDPLRGPAEEINQAADEALKKFPWLDASRQAAGGASYGGHLTNWLQATSTRYKCLVSHAGEADLIMQWGTSDSIFGREVNSGTPIWGDSKVWREQSPALQGGNHAKGTGFTSPILITVGELDYRVPLNNAIMWFALNQRLNVPSRIVTFPEENHWILKGENSKYWFGEVQGWLAKHLK